MTKLFETEHPYYAEEGCFYTPGTQWNDVHQTFSSWEDFFDSWGDTDPDMNLLYRWDWNTVDPDDYEEELEEDPDFDLPEDVLRLYFMLQRKAKPMSVFVNVAAEDEPAVRAWLEERAKTLQAVWFPLLGGEARVD